MQKLFDDKNKIDLPHPWDVYPELFAEEKEAYEKQALEQARAARKEYATKYNEMRRQRGLC